MAPRVYGFDAHCELFLLYHREATDEENEALDRTAEAVKAEVEASSGVEIAIVYNRLNRRKIDLIPEWPDPPKSRIGKLLQQTEKRLREGGYAAGIKGVYEAAGCYSQQMGLALHHHQRRQARGGGTHRQVRLPALDPEGGGGAAQYPL